MHLYIDIKSRVIPTNMQLTKQTDYAFRVLLYLCDAPAETLSNVKDICAFHDISHNHVAKVVVKLTKLGYIDSVRGHGGGIRLAKPPEDINVAQVIRDFENTLEPVNCFTPRCAMLPGCKLKGVLFEAMNEFIESTARYTLADLQAK